jgi:phage terminase large subunit GpA-like protein
MTTIYGDPLENETWAELDDCLRTVWRHPNGGVLRVDAAAVDSGDGTSTNAVLDFTKPRLSRRIFAIKGVAGWTRPLIKQSQQRNQVLYLIGTDTGKLHIMQRLNTLRFSQVA